MLAHFGLREQPFGVTPDPRFFYPSASHREAMASLLYGVQSERAFMAMVAQPGMGKTMLLFNLLQQLGPSVRSAFLFQTQCDSREFLAFLLADLGITVREMNTVRMHEQLKAELLKEAHAGRKVVVIVDEAQNLDNSVLETVRLLSDFESPNRKLLHIVLAGQPQLAAKIASPELTQLRQRLSLCIQIQRLSREEVATYMARRLQVAGYNRAEALFSPEAVGLIAAHSRGIPRVINNFCFNALSIACALQKSAVDGAIVREVAQDLQAIERLANPDLEIEPEFVPVELPVFPQEEKRPPAVPVAVPTVAVAKSLAQLEQPPQPQREAALERWSAFASSVANVAKEFAHRARPVASHAATATKQVAVESSACVRRCTIAAGRGLHTAGRRSARFFDQHVVPASAQFLAAAQKTTAETWSALVRFFAFVLLLLIRGTRHSIAFISVLLARLTSNIPAGVPSQSATTAHDAAEYKAEGANV